MTTTHTQTICNVMKDRAEIVSFNLLSIRALKNGSLQDEIIIRLLSPQTHFSN